MRFKFDYTENLPFFRYVFQCIVNKNLNVRHSFRIYINDKPCLGSGRVELLQLIHKHGSIAKAATQMSLSYRKAWQMVKDLNALFKEPLVEVRLGGKKGGGAIVTDKGMNAISQYFALKQKADAFFKKEISNIKL